jgi:hypothetical protein
MYILGKQVHDCGKFICLLLLAPSDLQTFLQPIEANAVAKSTNRQKYIPITAKYDNFQAKLELAKKVTKKFVKSMIITS